MNAVREGAEVALGFMDSMKREPMALALCVLSFALIGLLYFQSAQFTNQRRENVALFIGVQKEVQALLSKCVIPPDTNRRGDLKHLLPSTQSHVAGSPPSLGAGP